MSTDPGILLNPHAYDPAQLDAESRALMEVTIGYFESLGKDRITSDDNEGVWYDDFCRFLADSKAFATLMTPAGHGAEGSHWDTWRNCHFSEITAFYSLGYWYAWQVSMLGLGPIWMGEDDYVFFVVEPGRDEYVLEKNTVHSPMFVSAFRLEDYPITDADILVRGP